MLLRKERKTSTLSFQSNQLWLKIQALLYFLLHLVRQFMTVSNNKKSYRDENFHRNERFISLFLFIYIKKFDNFHDFISFEREQWCPYNSNFEAVLMLHRVAIFYLKTTKEPIRIPLQFPFQNIICKLFLFISDSKIHLSPNQREYQIKNESITRPRVKPRWLRYKSGIYLNNLMSSGRYKISVLWLTFETQSSQNFIIQQMKTGGICTCL